MKSTPIFHLLAATAVLVEASPISTSTRPQRGFPDVRNFITSKLGFVHQSSLPNYLRDGPLPSIKVIIPSTKKLAAEIRNAFLRPREQIYLEPPLTPPPRDISADSEEKLEPAVLELNGFFAQKLIRLGDPCSPEREDDSRENDDNSAINKVCIGSSVAYCSPDSWAWEEMEDCDDKGNYCGAGITRSRKPDTWSIAISCVRYDNIF